MHKVAVRTYIILTYQKKKKKYIYIYIYITQVTSHTTTAIALYSAFTVDLETVFCFLDFQEIKESPRNTQ